MSIVPPTHYVIFKYESHVSSCMFIHERVCVLSLFFQIHAALTAVQFGRGQTRQAENEWSAIDKVDQDIFLKESYTKDKLKWPPRVSIVKL